MGLLDIYERTLENPTRITTDYFVNRGAGADDMNWWYYVGGSTWSIRKSIFWESPCNEENRKLLQNTSCVILTKDGERAYRYGIANIVFKYDFEKHTMSYELGDRNLLSIAKATSYAFAHKLKIDLQQAFEGRTKHIFENITTIQDFEVILYGIQAQLRQKEFYFSL